MNRKPLGFPNSNDEKELFLSINQQPFTELLTFIDFADEKLNIGFVEIKFSQDRDILINALLEHPDCHNIQFEVSDFSNPNLRFLRDELVAALKNIKIKPNKKLILLITGLEKSIGIVEEYPAVLTNLNFVRDDLRISVPHPMLLFLPDYALTRLAKYAPDFWAWGRKVFSFKTNRNNLMNISNNIVFSEQSITDLELADKQARLEQLLNLLNEYNGSIGDKNKNNLLTISNLYNQLGNAYYSLGQYHKAIIYHQQSLKISREIEDRLVEGMSLGNLGTDYNALGKYQQAITCHQKSLEIKREIKNKLREMQSLGSLGNVYKNLGQYQEAITFHEQSLKISREIGDGRGEATSLDNLGIAYQGLGQHQKAVTYHQKALEITTKMGDRRRVGICSSNLGVAYQSLGEYEKATLFHQQALEISRKIGNRRGECNSLNHLGNSNYALGQYEEALNYYQKSLEIAREIGYIRGEANAWFNLGLTFKNVQRNDDAIEAVHNARQLYQDMGLNQDVENCDNEINALESDISTSQE